MDRKVLLISSDEDTVPVVREALAPLGCTLVVKRGMATGLRAMAGGELVLLDLPDGPKALKEIQSYHPEASVVLLSDKGCSWAAIDAGAYDCLKKPLDPVGLRVAVRNAARHLSLREEVEKRMRSETPELVLGPNEKMSRVLRSAKRLSTGDTPVLITGERGSGRELVAKAIHLGGPRASGPFLALDASSAGVAEALFGSASAPGGLAKAEGGTVLLKDFAGLEGEDAERFQALLGDGRYTPPGLSGPVKADVRVICSLNGTALAPGLAASFPSVLRLPPLRERPEDILPLAEQFLSEAAAAFGTGAKALSKEAVKALQKHQWPGNAGELKNAMARACLVSKGPRVEARHLALEEGSPHYSVREFLEDKLKRYIKDVARLGNAGLYDTVLSEVEKSLIELVLEATGGNQLRAAAALGINRTTLRTKARAYRIKQKKARPGPRQPAK